MFKISYKLKLFLLYFISVVLATFLVYKLINTFHETSVENISQQYFQAKAEEREEYFHDFFRPYFTTIHSIQSSQTLLEFLSNETKRDKIEEYFLNLKRALPCATQIRYLNSFGEEIIRVDGTPVSLMKEKAISKIVPQEELQNKAPCPYIQEFLHLQKGEIGISKIELNIEHGKISLPKQPTLRLGMLVFDAQNNEKGLVIINICLKTFFQLFNKTTLYNVHLIDEKGNFLNHHNPKYGLLGSDMEHSIFDDFPEHAWDILENDQYYGESFYAQKIENFNNGQNVKILLELKFEEKLKQKEITQRNFTIISILFAVIIIPIIIYLAKLPDILKEKLNQKKEIENKNIFINTLLKSIPIPMFYKNLDGTYFDINQEFTNVFGFEYDQLIGKSAYEVVENENATMFRKKDQELINSKTHETQIYQSTVTNLKTKKIHNVIFHKNLFFDINNKPLGIIGAAIDITEITQIKKELEELNKDLELRVHKEVEKNLVQEIQLFESSKLAAMGEMMNNIIHQWSQPLTIISLKASYIESLAKTEEPIEHQLIQEEMEYITHAITRLSEVTKTFAEFIKEKKEKKTVNLQETIDKSLVISGTVLKDKGYELLKQIDYNDPIMITTIPNELIEVIINIINNAIDILEEKHIENGFVKIILTKDTNSVFISIEDNGGGIPQEVLPKIFDEYFTTKSKDKGTGIGLYMSKKMVTTSLEGKLDATNTQKGARFTITLPFT